MRAHQRVTQAGPGNQQVREYLELRRSRGGRSPTRAAIEGLGLIDAALTHGATIEVALACPALLRGTRADGVVARLAAAGVPMLQVSERTFERLTARDGPDGLAAIVRVRTVPLHEVAVGGVARALVLDRFEHPGNVGSLIRCAGAVGATAVIVTDQLVRLNHPLVVKASAGAIFSVAVTSARAEDALVWLRAHAFQVVAADPAASRSYRSARYGPRVAVVLGSERHGLATVWRNGADELLAIPMAGRVDSLNAGHAGALFLYEVAHRHRVQGA